MKIAPYESFCRDSLFTVPQFDSSGVTTDILGVTRPQGSVYDIGAYEYYDIPVTLTTVPVSLSNNSSPSFAGTSSTIGAGSVLSISYSVDGEGWSSSGVSGTSSFNITVPNVADGTHTVRVKATDSYGNTSDSSLYGSATFSIDTVVKTKGVETCNKPFPQFAPVLTSIISTQEGEATLTFYDPNTKDTPIDSYFIEYGTYPNLYPYATQSIGGKGTTIYTVKSLNPNKIYYFRVRSGNGCATGPWSSEISAQTLGLATPNSLNTTQLNLEPVTDTSGGQTTTQSEGYSLNVKVKDTKGNPIQGASVTIHSNVQTATTNKDGIAEFKGVERGEHKVLIAYNNYSGEESINLTADSTIKEFSLRVTIQPKNVLLSPRVIAVVGVLTLVIISLVIVIIRLKKKG